MAIAKVSKYLAVIFTVAAIALAGLSIAAVTVNKSVSSSGTITTGPNVAVYSDSACTDSVASINWGSINVGGSASQTVYVADKSNVAMTLSLSVTNWSPSTACNYMNLTWTGQGAQIPAGASLAVTLTLTVSSNITGITSFSNSIMISGTG